MAESQVWNNPVSIVRHASGFVLLSIESDFSLSSAAASVLVVTLVSDRGAMQIQRRFPVPLRVPTSSPNRVSLDSDGNVIIAIAGSLPERPAGQSTVSTNPRTGSKRTCIIPDATYLVSVDLRTLDVRAQKTIHDGQIASLRQLDGRLYAAFDFNTNCRLEKSLKVFEVGAGFELKTIFQADNANSIDVTDFEVTKDRFVLVGMIRTFLPTSIVKDLPSLEQLKGDQNLDSWLELLLESGEDHTSAFVLVLDRDGSVVADRVFPDVRNRHLSNVVADKSGRFIAVGTAFGDRGWAISFTLRQAGLDGPKGFPSWLKWLLGPFGRTN